MGVSGGGGEPRLARVVEFDAVELKRFTAAWSGALKLFELSPGGGK